MATHVTFSCARGGRILAAIRQRDGSLARSLPGTRKECAMHIYIPIRLPRALTVAVLVVLCTSIGFVGRSALADSSVAQQQAVDSPTTPVRLAGGGIVAT